MRILLVEDETELARGLARLLRKLGHTVRRTSDGETASSLLEKTDYHIAIIDLRLGQFHGVELVRKIHQRNCRGHPAVIVMTAFADDLPVTDPEDYGAACVLLEKPVTHQEMREAVRRCQKLLHERENRRQGAEVCERLIDEGKLQFEEGKIAVIDVEKEEAKVFSEESEAIEHARKHRGGRTPYFHYFNSRLCRSLRRMQG